MKIYHLFFFVLMFITNNTFSQNYPTNWHRANGDINTMAADSANNLLYLGGSFNGFYPQYNDFYGSFLDFTSGESDTSFANPNSYVYASTPDGNGGIFIAGSFTKFGDSLRTYIAHLNALGEVTDWNAAIDSTNSLTQINTILLVGNTLYVGGVFSSVQGQTRYNLAAFNKTTGELLPWEPSNDSMIIGLAEYNGSIFAGGWGTFSSPFTTASNAVAMLDPNTGAVQNWYPLINSGSVKSFAFSGDSVFIGGNFQSISGQSRNGLACISLIDGSLSSWNPVLNTSFNTPDVKTLILNDTILYIGGVFEGVNGDLTRKYVSAFDINSGLSLSSFTPSFDSYVHSMLLLNDTLIVGGTFSITNNTFQPYLIKLNSSTGETINWDAGIGSHVYTLSAINSHIFVGGAQEISEVKYRNLLAAFDLNTGKPNSFRCLPFGGDTINKILLNDSILFFGGSFTSVDGLNRFNLASYNTSTNSLTNWNPNINGAVRSMVIIENILFIGGDFTEASGQERNHLASFDLATGNLTSWNPNVDGPIYDLTHIGNYLAIGGNFNNIDTDSRSNVARFYLNSLTLDAWAPQVNNTVKTICEYGNDILLGGEFTFIDTISRSFLASVTNSTGFTNPLNLNPNEKINKIKSINNHVYLAGAFTSIDGEIREQIAEINVDSSIVTSWTSQSQFYYEAKDICAMNSEVFFSGDNNFYVSEENGLMKTMAPATSPSLLPLSVSAFAFPSSLNPCNGQAYFSALGPPLFTFSINSGQQIATTNGFVSFDSLCPGIHNITVHDYYGDSISSFFIIPTLENTISPINSNLSTVVDLLGQTLENCTIDYTSIDTVYILSSTYSNDTITVVWEIIDANGTHNTTAYYFLDDLNFNGNYYLQYNSYCLNSGDVFSTTQPYLFQGSSLTIGEEISDLESQILVFPNPSTETLKIETNGNHFILIIQDAQGKSILEKEISKDITLDLRSFKNGIYFFTFISPKNKIVKKVIKI